MQPERKGLHFTAMIPHTMQIILQELISDIDTQIASVKKAFFQKLSGQTHEERNNEIREEISKEI